MEYDNRVKTRSLRRIIGLAIIIVAVGIFAYRAGWVKPLNPSLFMKNEPGSYAVKTVLDGDTIIVDMHGVDETVRFIGIDTPETHKPNTPVECYGPNAATYTKSKLEGTRVRLIADRLTTNRDRYNRLLRYVVTDDGVYMNEYLVQNGYAFAYAFPFAKSQSYSDEMQKARTEKRGLWGLCTPTQNAATGQWHSNPLNTVEQTAN